MPAATKKPRGRIDERDTMFARMARTPGTPAYEEYYGQRSELKKTDDHLRDMPGLLEPGGRHYDPIVCGEAARHFSDIDHLTVDAATVAVWKARLVSSSTPSETIKQMVRAFGAVAVGCTALDQEYIYTHKGRFDQDYGRVVQLDHQSVIVFLVEMDFEEMQQAPEAPAIRESARQYLRAAEISRRLEAVLRVCGYAAKAHYDAHYDVILPPLAVSAGLGELGRNNILIADRYGSRVRIGAVSTTFPLEHDRPVSLGTEAFCTVCLKCAENCPSRALSLGEKVSVLGVEKWPTDVERCYGYWRAVGTDCGICMAVCPFSHRDTWFHGLVRRLVRRPWVAPLALFFDDLIYGREWKRRRRSPNPDRP